jgi:hypothetical protein
MRSVRGRTVAVASAVAVLFMMTACAGTKLVAKWKDDAFQSRPAKIFVIGVSDQRGPRSLVEDEFVRQFKARGTDAVASYTVFPEGPRPTKDEVLAKTKELNADAIMVIRFLKKETGDTHTPSVRYAVPAGFESSWGSYTSTSMGVATDVGIRDVSYDTNVISMDMVLYQTATGKPIWSALSQTTYQEGPIKQIKPFTTAVMKELAHEKLVR